MLIPVTKLMDWKIEAVGGSEGEEIDCEAYWRRGDDGGVGYMRLRKRERGRKGADWVVDLYENEGDDSPVRTHQIAKVAHVGGICEVMMVVVRVGAMENHELHGAHTVVVEFSGNVTFRVDALGGEYAASLVQKAMLDERVELHVTVVERGEGLAGGESEIGFDYALVDANIESAVGRRVVEEDLPW